MKQMEARVRSVLSLFFASELRAWRGQMPLGVVFWGYGVAAGLVLAALFATALDRGQLALQQLLVPVSAGYTAWIVVAIWRSAAGAAPLWRSLARWLAVAWALNSAFVLFFLQIELVLRYAQG